MEAIRIALPGAFNIAAALPRAALPHHFARGLTSTIVGMGRRRLKCWPGMASVRRTPPGLSAAKEQPATFSNGTLKGGHRIGAKPFFWRVGSLWRAGRLGLPGLRSR